MVGLAGEAYEFSTNLRSILWDIGKDLLRFNFYALIFSMIVTLVPIAYSVLYLLTGKTPLKLLLMPFIYLDVGIFFLSVLLIGFEMTTNDDEGLQEKLQALLWFLGTDGILSIGLYTIFQSQNWDPNPPEPTPEPTYLLVKDGQVVNQQQRKLIMV